MEKKNFIALLMGVIGGLIFSLGMCMCLLPQWGMFTPGVVCAAIGAVILVITLLVYRKMSGAEPIKVNWKVVGKVSYGVFASLVLGAGMSMIMVLDMMILGMVLGVVGIVLLLFLIPMCLGFKKSTM